MAESSDPVPALGEKNSVPLLPITRERRESTGGEAAGDLPRRSEHESPRRRSASQPKAQRLLEMKPQRSLESGARALQGPDEFMSWLARDRSSHGLDPHAQRTAATEEEIEMALASLNPADLLQGGLVEWRERSNSLRLMKSRKYRRSFQSSRASSLAPSKLPDGPSSSSGLHDHRVSIDYQDVDNYGGNSRHKLYSSEKPPLYEVGGKRVPEAELPDEYVRALAATPQATMIHLVIAYHQALVVNGLREEALKIANALSELGFKDVSEMQTELTGVDLLLKDGLLKYLMQIQPHIPAVPPQVVKFKDLTFSITVQLDPGYESIGTKVRGFAKPFKKAPLESVTLLRDVTGYLMPGTLTVVLGPKGCGKTVIHKALSGRSREPGNALQGTVTYNGQSVYDVNYQRLVSIGEPVDVHLANLTVRETVEFARDCTQYLKRKHFSPVLKELTEKVLEAGQDPKLELNLSILGLKRVADRRVGHPLRPIITEAERHRLSVAEMMAGTYPVYMFDQLNSGVDDSWTFDLVTGIRIFTRVRETTVVASLIQPSQEVFDLFDRILLLDQGQVVYQGPRLDAQPYFERLGYVKPMHVSVPEFLEEVTTPHGVQFLRPGYPRLDLDDFVYAYQNSDAYKDICRVVDNPSLTQELWVEGSHPLGVTFMQTHSGRTRVQGVDDSLTTLIESVSENGGSLVEPSMDHTGKVQAGDEVIAVGTPTTILQYVKVDPSKAGSILDGPQQSIRFQLERPYGETDSAEPFYAREFVQEPWEEFKVLLRRELRSQRRNRLSLTIRAVQVLILASYTGFIFFRVKKNADSSNMSLLRSVFFVSLLDMTLFNLGQLPALLEERAIYYKQQDAHYFRPKSYLFAKMLGSLPFSLAEATSWTLIVYFTTNLSISDGGRHFWTFYSVILLSVLNGAFLVRFVSAFAPDAISANGMVGIMIAIFITFAGFLVPRLEVPKYWIWAYYIDPLQWGIHALMINEFNSANYRVLCKDSNVTLIPQCRGQNPDQTIGRAFLVKGQFYTGDHWIAISIAVLVGWLIVWTVLTLGVLTRVRHKPKTVITPSAEAKYIRRESEENEDLFSAIPKLSHYALPMVLSWHEVSYEIMLPSIGHRLQILTSISGWAEPDEMIGILGASGSGKTTLLNCLAGRRVMSNRMGGQILVNGYPREPKAFARVVGYVDSLEALSPYMTIREAVAFNTALHLGKILTSARREEYVEQVLVIMGLKSIEHTLVKSLSLSYLTSVEAERLAIAAELARNPSVMFLDMPTRNLDSRSALEIITTLKHIAGTGRIVIVALGMPSQRILSTLTSVQILKRGGESVYFGAVGKNAELVKDYFESLPGSPLCPPNMSVSTYAINLIGDGMADSKSIKDYAFEYRVSELALHNHIELQRLRQFQDQPNFPRLENRGYGSYYGTRAKQLFLKLNLFYYRNVLYSWGRIFSGIATALLLGSIFFNQPYDTLPGMNTRSGSIFLSSLLLAISNAQSVIPQVVLQRTVYARDKASRQYNTFLFNLNWTIGEVPYVALSTLIYCFIYLFMVQMAVDSRLDFVRYWFVLFELTLAITFLGMLLASIGVVAQVAGTLVTLLIGFWTATSGVVVPKTKVLPTALWIFWTNPIQYALNALTSIAFFCDVNKPECLNGGQNVLCRVNPTACPRCDCPRLKDSQNVFVWSTIQKNRSLDHSRIGLDMLTLFWFMVIFRVATFMVWRVRDRSSKSRTK